VEAPSGRVVKPEQPVHLLLRCWGKCTKVDTGSARVKTVQREIIINAPAEKVWAALTTFALYQEWNPFISAVTGKASVGERLRVKAKLPGLPEIAFGATVKSSLFPVELEWQAIFLKGVFEASHSFTIERLAVGECRFLHVEQFSGILSAAVLFLLEGRFCEGYRLMNEALKARVERREE